MEEVFRTFKANIGEVDRYFRFMSLAAGLDEGLDAELHLPDRRSWRTHPIDTDTQRMLKATSLLVLYNLAESTIRLRIAAIYRAVEGDDLTYEQLSEELRNRWIRYRTRNLTGQMVGADKIRDAAKGVADEIIARAIISIDSDFINVAGNIDGRKIRGIAKELGFSSTVHESARNGVCLKIVKEKRNDLAHGVVTFATCGGELTPGQLETYKKEVVIYLRYILRNIERYLRGKKYVA